MRSFYIDFDGTDWITTVFVNGQKAGEKIGTRMPWDCDITPYVSAGDNTDQTIEIFVKGPRYAIDAYGSHVSRPNECPSEKLSDYMGVTDYSLLKWNATITPSSKGDANGLCFGITDELSIVSTGDVKAPYVTDVFVQTKHHQQYLYIKLYLN